MRSRRESLRRMARLRAMSDAALSDLLAAAGNSAQVLADRVGVTHRTVWMFLKGRGIRWTPDLRRPLLEGLTRPLLYRAYLEHGRNIARMAKAFGVHRYTMRRRLRQMGVDFTRVAKVVHRKAAITVSRELLIQLYEVERWPTRRIAAVVGVTRSTVRRYFKEFGVPFTVAEVKARLREWEGRPLDIEAERRRLTSRFVDGTVAAAMTSPHMRDED